MKIHASKTGLNTGVNGPTSFYVYFNKTIIWWCAPFIGATQRQSRAAGGSFVCICCIFKSFKMAVSADSLDKKAVQDIVDQHKDGKETGHGIEFVKHLGKSHLWVSFQKLKLDGVVVPYVVCTICYGVLKYTPSDGTGGMKRHVHRVRQEAASSNTQLKISGFTSTTFEPGVYRKAKKQITTSVVQFCAKDIRPFNIVEGEGFKGVARELINIGAKYGRIQVEQVLPCGQTISNNVDETYKKLKEAVNEELRKVGFVLLVVITLLFMPQQVKTQYVHIR